MTSVVNKVARRQVSLHVLRLSLVIVPSNAPYSTSTEQRPYQKDKRAKRGNFQQKADSPRALKTRQLRRLTKRVATPTEFSNEEIYKNSRSNLDERF